MNLNKTRCIISHLRILRFTAQISHHPVTQHERLHQLRCISSSSPLFTTPVNSLPGYNYGLAGKGKSKRSTKQKLTVDVEGEILFGLHSVYLALKAKRRKAIHTLYVNEKYGTSLKKAVPMLDEICHIGHENGIPLKLVRKQVLDLMAGNRPHQGVCLDTEEIDCPFWNESIAPEWRNSQGPSLWLLLHNVQDPMNFGAVLRSSYFMGVEKVIIPEGNSCKLSPVVSKASAGVLEVIDLLRLSNTTTEVEFCQWWKSHSGHVLGTYGSPGIDDDGKCTALQDFTMSKPSLLVLGNEGSGLSEDIVSLCDVKLQIQNRQIGYHKEVDSLNVSVAAGM